MGLHFSRLAVAVSLALSCSVLPAMAAADQPLDEFYIEIKGPDKPTSPLLTPKAENSDSTPVRAQPEKRPAVRRAAEPLRAGVVQPFSPDTASAAVDNAASAGRYGPVRGTETLWSIAEKVRPGKQVSVYQTLLALYRKNPGAFANGRISNIYRGAMLSLPTLAQVQAESEALAQELVRKGALNLAAKPAAKPATKANPRVVKLSPAAETKPVVKLTPATPAVTTTAVASDTATPAPTSAPSAETSSAQPTTTSTAATAPATEQVGNQLTLSGQPAQKPVVDASVSALVTGPSAAANTSPAAMPASEAQPAATSQAVTTESAAPYQQQIAQLTDDNRALKTQLKEVNRQLDDIRSLLMHQASAAKAPVAPEAEKSASPAAEKPSWLHDLIAAPINLALLLTLPVLLVLAVVSLWLRSRNRRNQAAEQEEAETAALMADGDSHFDHLMAADMVAMSNMPDLEQQDETVLPQPEFMVDDPDHEPALDLSAMPAATREPGLLPEMDDPNLDLHEAELDLSVADSSKRPNAPVDEADFLSELGVNDLNDLPEDEPMAGAADDALAAVDRETFEPRASANLSNDELDALFQSIDDLADSEPVHLDDAPTAAAPVEMEPLQMAAVPEVEVPDLDALAASAPVIEPAPLMTEPVVSDVPAEEDGLSFALFEQADHQDDHQDEVVSLSSVNPQAVDEVDETVDAVPTAAEPVLASVDDLPRVDAVETADAVTALPLADHSEADHLQASLHAAAQAREEADAPLPAADWYPQDEEPAIKPSTAVAPATPASASDYRDIDDLLAEAEKETVLEEPYAGLSLDVGLDEFPEVLPDARGVDVDAEGELAAKLDLARAYLEIDDKTSASELLQEVVAQGDNQQKAEAQRLLRRLR